MSEAPVKAQAYSVKVRSGRHAGASVGLDDGRYLVGSGGDADIVLTDTGIAGNHAEIRLTKGVCRLRPVGGDVSVEGRVLSVGVAAEIRLPAKIVMNGVQLSFESALHPVGERAVGSAPRLSRIAMGLAGIVGVAIIGGFVVFDGFPAASRGFPDLGRSAGGTVRSDGPATETSSAAVTTAPASPTAAQAMSAGEALTKRLRENGLAGMIMVASAGGSVEVRGAIRPENEREWTDAQAWFDATYKGRIPILTRVKVEENAITAPRLAIRGIWSGKDAYVISGDGDKYGVGAKLPGGWMIERIERDQVVVARQGERLNLVP